MVEPLYYLQLSLYMAAIMVELKSRWLVKIIIFLFFTLSHTRILFLWLESYLATTFLVGYITKIFKNKSFFKKGVFMMESQVKILPASQGVFMKSRLKILPAFVGVIVFSFALYGIMVSMQPGLIGASGIIEYNTWETKAVDEPFYRFLWLIGDMTEAHFHKSILGGLGLVLFAFVAYILSRTKSKWQGYSISYGTGLFPWVFISSLIGLSLSVYLFGDNLSNGWMPTFVPFVSVPAAVVLVYGGGWKNTLMGGILGALFTYPISTLIIENILKPWNLPALSGNVLGMCLGAIIVFEICHAVPWMKMPEKTQTEDAETSEEVKSEESSFNNIWFFRRLLTDWTECNFFGNELASAGLILGSILSWILNPSHTAYGSLNFPALLLSQFLSGAIALFLYYDNWKKYGWYPTFLPVVSIAPAIVLFFGGTMQSVLAGSILGAIAAPPLAHLVSRNVPSHWHPFVGNTLSMGVCTAVITAMLKFIGL